jgi:hypothetical protein
MTPRQATEPWRRYCVLTCACSRGSRQMLPPASKEAVLAHQPLNEERNGFELVIVQVIRPPLLHSIEGDLQAGRCYSSSHRLTTLPQLEPLCASNNPEERHLAAQCDRTDWPNFMTPSCSYLLVHALLWCWCATPRLHRLSGSTGSEQVDGRKNAILRNSGSRCGHFTRCYARTLQSRLWRTFQLPPEAS